MKKEELKRLKAGLLALILCFSLSACKDKKEKEESGNQYAVVFIEGKALIYSGTRVSIIEEYSGFGGSALKYSEKLRFSVGTDVAEVQSMEDAVELATAIVGEDNIIYMDYQEDNLVLTYEKGN